MKIKESVYEKSDAIHIFLSDLSPLKVFNILSLPVWIGVIGIGLSIASQSVKAGTEDTGLYYRYVPYQGPSSSTGTGSQATQQPSGASSEQVNKAEQSTSTGEKGGGAGQAAAGGQTMQQQSSEQKTEGGQKTPAERPQQSTGEFPSASIPSFTELDVNGDHYITKDELKNFPELLRVFDKIDAGKDGRLEQHEFANLEMETSREGEF